MAFLGVKLSDGDQKILEERAMKRGKTLSDYIRDLIRNDNETNPIAEALLEIKNLQAQENAAIREELKNISTRLNASGHSGQSPELREIKRIISELDKRSIEQHRIITLLGLASPFVSRQLGQT